MVDAYLVPGADVRNRKCKDMLYAKLEKVMIPRHE